MAAGRYGYRPQIDGLRALAVGGVLLNHFWFPHGPFGHLGVRLFFVISGFLITERLLDARASVEGGASRPLQEGLAFFLRRALRLFPAYYLLLTLLLITDAGGIRASAPWHIFNLTNFWFVKIDDWSPWMIAHFWSLSIEEQFYLVWPWVILLLPMRAIGPAVVATILLGIGFRAGVLMTSLADRQTAIWVLTPAAFDALGAGALLALLARRGLNIAPVTWLLAPAALLWLAIDVSSRKGWLPDTLYRSYLTQDTISTVAFAALVATAHLNRVGLFGKALGFGPFVACGRISYGIYLYHMPVLAVLFTPFPHLDYGPRRFLIAGAATLIVATLSWKLWERPFLRIKERV